MPNPSAKSRSPRILLQTAKQKNRRFGLGEAPAGIRQLTAWAGERLRRSLHAHGPWGRYSRFPGPDVHAPSITQWQYLKAWETFLASFRTRPARDLTDTTRCESEGKTESRAIPQILLPRLFLSPFPFPPSSLLPFFPSSPFPRLRRIPVSLQIHQQLRDCCRRHPRNALGLIDGVGADAIQFFQQLG